MANVPVPVNVPVKISLSCIVCTICNVFYRNLQCLLHPNAMNLRIGAMNLHVICNMFVRFGMYAF